MAACILDVCFRSTSTVTGHGVGLKPDLQKKTCAWRLGFSPTKVLAKDSRNGHRDLLIQRDVFQTTGRVVDSYRPPAKPLARQMVYRQFVILQADRQR